jgi:hypothetical protein
MSEESPLQTPPPTRRMRILRRILFARTQNLPCAPQTSRNQFVNRYVNSRPLQLEGLPVVFMGGAAIHAADCLETVSLDLVARGRRRISKSLPAQGALQDPCFQCTIKFSSSQPPVRINRICVPESLKSKRNAEPLVQAGSACRDSGGHWPCGTVQTNGSKAIIQL